jgi:hypothetical protein
MVCADGTKDDTKFGTLREGQEHHAATERSNETRTTAWRHATLWQAPALR